MARSLPRRTGPFSPSISYRPARGAEERIASYDEALENLVDGATSGPAHRHDFIEIAVDLAPLHEPEDAIVTAHALAPLAPSPGLYEELGSALLTAARQAHLGHQLDPARHILKTARYAFDLAESLSAEDTESLDREGLLHRAILGLEASLTEAWPDARDEAAPFLKRIIAADPEDHTSAWARRMLLRPATYSGEVDFDFSTAHHSSGNLSAPVKIFTPAPRCSSRTRKACINGLVIVQTVVDRHGSIAGVRLLKGVPVDFSQEALRTLSTWLFEPAVLNGQPTPVTYSFVLRFHWGRTYGAPEALD